MGAKSTSRRQSGSNRVKMNELGRESSCSRMDKRVERKELSRGVELSLER